MADAAPLAETALLAGAAVGAPVSRWTDADEAVVDAVLSVGAAVGAPVSLWADAAGAVVDGALAVGCSPTDERAAVPVVVPPSSSP